MINGLEFYTDADTKPVALDWRFGNTHAFEVSAARGYFRPTLLMKQLNIGLTATGDVDGKQVSASQSWRKSLWAGGVTLVNSQPGMCVELAVLGGSRYARVSGTAVWGISSGLLFSAGWRWEETRLEGLTIRENAPFIGVVAGW